MRNQTWWVYVLFGLAFLGLVVSLVNDTVGLLVNILVSVAIGGLIFGAIYFFFIKPKASNDIKKYRRAVKQSKQKNNRSEKRKTVSKKPIMMSANKNKKKRPSHLKVIEGNKEKNKNRASF